MSRIKWAAPVWPRQLRPWLGQWTAARLQVPPLLLPAPRPSQSPGPEYPCRNKKKLKNNLQYKFSIRRDARANLCILFPAPEHMAEHTGLILSDWNTSLVMQKTRKVNPMKVPLSNLHAECAPHSRLVTRTRCCSMLQGCQRWSGNVCQCPTMSIRTLPLTVATRAMQERSLNKSQTAWQGQAARTL